MWFKTFTPKSAKYSIAKFKEELANVLLSSLSLERVCKYLFRQLPHELLSYSFD